jgi:hypothetical protein
MIRESDHFLSVPSVLAVVKSSQSQKKRFNTENTKGTEKEAWVRAF